MTHAICACSEPVWVAGRRQSSEASAGEHWAESSTANLGLQVTRYDMCEWERRVGART